MKDKLLNIKNRFKNFNLLEFVYGLTVLNLLYIILIYIAKYLKWLFQLIWVLPLILLFSCNKEKDYVCTISNDYTDNSFEYILKDATKEEMKEFEESGNFCINATISFCQTTECK